MFSHQNPTHFSLHRKHTSQVDPCWPRINTPPPTTPLLSPFPWETFPPGWLPSFFVSASVGKVLWDWLLWAAHGAAVVYMRVIWGVRCLWQGGLGVQGASWRVISCILYRKWMKDVGRKIVSKSSANVKIKDWLSADDAYMIDIVIYLNAYSLSKISVYNR